MQRDRGSYERSSTFPAQDVPELRHSQCGAATLEPSGHITGVNFAWRQLGLAGPDQRVPWADLHEDFLAALGGSRNASGLALRDGVASVLSAERASFEHIYRCHTPTDLRWCRLRALRCAAPSTAVLVEQSDITELQLAHARLNIQNAVATAFNSRLPMLAGCRQLALALCEELDWDFAGIWTLEPTSWTLRCVDTWVRPDDALREFELATRSAALVPSNGLPGRAWTSAAVQWVTHVDVDPEAPRRASAPSTIMPPAALRSGFRTALCFPLKCAGDVLAVVELCSRTERREDRALMRLLDVAGEQLALWELRERAESYAVVAQEQADQARMQLESVLDCTPAFITAIDREDKIMFINRTVPVERKSEAIGTPWRQFIMPDSQADVAAALQGVFTDGGARDYEAKVPMPGGTWRWYANHVGPMRGAGDAIVGAVIISQDVTVAKRAHEELLAAQRLAAVGTLAAGVAHEINTPVQFVSDSIHFLRSATEDIFVLIEKFQTFLRLVRDSTDAPSLLEAARAVAEAEENADLAYMHINVPKAFARCIDGLERVATIVRSMKEFSHPAQKEMAPIDLNRAIMATLTVARNEYKYVADLETELAPLPLVTCHANDINQAVLNILVNAAHAIADTPQASERGLIKVTTTCDDAWVTISIRDTGGGIPEAAREHIFDPFFTTKAVGRGTGQGLSLAWAAVRDKHGGELSFETTVGAGTTFYIRLPIAGRSGVGA